MPGLELVDIVGPVCESGTSSPKTAISTVAATCCAFSQPGLGFSMSSQYNSRPCAEVLIEGGPPVLSAAERVDDLVAAEREPSEGIAFAE
jgi:hypothetical protein